MLLTSTLAINHLTYVSIGATSVDPDQTASTVVYTAFQQTTKPDNYCRDRRLNG